MLDTTNILGIILNSKQCSKTCFLCFKNESNALSIFTDLEIITDCLNLSFTLANIMKQLFPSHEILFDQACEECTKLLLKMFLKLYKYKNNMIILDNVVKNLNRQVQEINNENMDKVFIRINRPKDNIIKENSKLTSNIAEKTLDCNKFDTTFMSTDLVQDHKRSLNKNTSEATVCDVCGQTFKTPNSLKAHINSHIEKECPYCFKSLKCHSHYNIHLKRHISNVKRKQNKLYYSCTSCNYQTLNKKTLEAHINKIHLHVRPYVCETCYKGFYKKSHLTEHVNTHLQIKNKTCEICGEHFVNERTLMEHQRLHSDAKPYQCNICSKRFVTSGRRSDHIKRTHMEKTEACLFCEKKFSLRKELNRHIKKCHSEIPLSIDNDFDVNISSYKFDDTLVLPIS